LIFDEDADTGIVALFGGALSLLSELAIQKPHEQLAELCRVLLL
jgi:hypothetical protein